MTRGGKAALLTATVALGGCVASSGNLKIRAVADPISALPRGDEMAVARGQLALGNVGLAIEAFRKVQRYQPSDPGPLVGLADCYTLMGRLDLAQSNYEAALALAPRDPALLRGLARIFEFEGQPERAALARRDAQAAASAMAAASPAPATPASIAAVVPTAHRSSVTVALPPARSADAKPAARPVAAPAPVASASITVKLPPARPAEPQVAKVAVTPAPAVQQAVASPSVTAKILALATEPVDLAAAPATKVQETELPQLSPGASIEVPPEPAMPAPRLAAAPIALDAAAPATKLAGGGDLGRFSSTVPLIPAAESVPAIPRPAKMAAPVDVAAPPVTKLQAAELDGLAPKMAMAVPVAPPPSPRDRNSVPDALPVQALGPRLVRISPREVELVTTTQPSWHSMASSSSSTTTKTRMATITAVKWIPLNQPGMMPNVQVVNAARSQGLAASARTVLSDRGWRRIAIGTAVATRDTSVVYYPRERAKLGRSLAAQFGIRSHMVSGKTVVVYLGKDKVGTVRALRA